MQLSVIIPTYRRHQSLRRALESAVRQTLEEFEVVVVDNSADSEAERIVCEMAEDHPAKVRYLREPTLGLHYARHAGARAARGRLLVFTDDDATFEELWLAAYVKAFTEHPEMGAAGGPIRAAWEGSPPLWLRDYIGASAVFPILSLMEPGHDFVIDQRGFFFGTNMAIRRDVLFAAGGFNPESFGDEWLGDGESGLNRKLWDRHVPIGYVPDAVVYHHIPPDRMTLAYCRQRMAKEGACQAYTMFHSRVPGFAGLLLRMCSMVARYGAFWLADSLLRTSTNRQRLRLQLFACRTRAQFAYAWRLMQDEELKKLVLENNWLTGPGAESL